MNTTDDTQQNPVPLLKDGLPRQAFAIIEDPESPSTWYLPHHTGQISQALAGHCKLESTVDWMLMGRAIVFLSYPNVTSQCPTSDKRLLFDGARHESVCRHPQLAKRSLVVGSFGKTFHATGWKMGYVLAPENLMAEFRKTHQFIVFAVNTPIQYALAEFMQDKSNYMGLPAFYQERRDFFVNLLRESRFKIIPSHGTYFQLLDYSGITKEKDLDYANHLTREFGLASIPVSAFYQQKTDNKVLRFCFAKKDETLERAAEILCKI